MKKETGTRFFEFAQTQNLKIAVRNALQSIPTNAEIVEYFARIESEYVDSIRNRIQQLLDYFQPAYAESKVMVLKKSAASKYAAEIQKITDDVIFWLVETDPNGLTYQEASTIVTPVMTSTVVSVLVNIYSSIN